MTSKKTIEPLLIEFLFFVEDCYHKTSYVDDKKTYAKDALMVIGWLKKLNTKISVDEYIKYFNSDMNTKPIFENWRQGQWGELFESKFLNLQKDINKNI
jgi:hypothetical protein